MSMVPWSLACPESWRALSRLMVKVPLPRWRWPLGMALPEMRVTNWAVAFAFERAPRVQSNEPFAASLTVSLYSFGSSAPEPGPQVQLLPVQLVGSVAVTAETAPSVHAVPALIENANATVALYQGSAPTRACDDPSAVSAFDCDACACCGPIATPELSGIASRAWSLNAALPPHAAARTHERASSLRIGRAPFPAGGLGARSYAMDTDRLPGWKPRPIAP